ncbi:hypothetical protein V6N13_086846 [Hibiscus sabdariffa]
MEFPAEQQQYQYHQQQQQAYQYDSSQYDHQSAASYYAYANQQHQQHHQYYPPQDYYSQPYPQFYQEPAPMHPPGVPLDQSVHHNHSAVYYQPQHPVIPVPGSDSSAVAASFVGNNPPPQQVNRTVQQRFLVRGAGLSPVEISSKKIFSGPTASY